MTRLLALLLLFPLYAFAECVVSVRWNDDVPYSFKDAQGAIHGISADITSEVLRRMDCTPRWVEMPWARALIELEAGRLDVLPGALRKPEREVYALFSVPYNNAPNRLYLSRRAATRALPASIEQLLASDLRLGVQIGVAYGGGFDALLASPGFATRLEKTGARKQLWLMLDAGRIDGVIADEFTAPRELKEIGLTDQVVATEIAFTHEPALIAFSKRTVSAEFVALFNRHFKAMLHDGSYVEILERHLPCKASATKLGCR